MSQYTLTRACPAATATRIASACPWHSRRCATGRPKGSLWLALLARSQCRKRVWRLDGNPFNADSEGVLPDDPMRTAMRQMVGVFAELERRMVVKRLRDGRRWKAELGGSAYGSPTFGQRAEDDELVTDEDESVTLARIRELQAAGLSFRAMAEVLTAEGRQPKRSNRWHPQSLARIVTHL